MNLATLTAQAVALAGSQERFDSLLSAKAQQQSRPLGRTMDTERADTLAVIADLKASRTPLEQAQATVTELRALTMTLGASEAKLLAQVTALTTEVATLKTEQITVLASVEKRASTLALDICAGQGVPAVNVERADGIHNKVKSKDELHVEYASIADPKARAQFWLKHEAAMMKKD